MIKKKKEMVNKISNYLSEWSKIILRLLIYKEERKRLLKEREIRKMQDRELPDKFDKNCTKLIVFVVPGANWHTGEETISGGILSIASLYEETLKLKEIHQSEVIMMTGPGEYLLFKHIKFENNISVFRFEQLFSYFEQLEYVLFHIPEFRVVKFISPKYSKLIKQLSRIDYVHINILNQNIRLMPEPDVVNQLKQIASIVTQTTAHEKYTTFEIRQKWDIPLHRFSVFGSPEKYIKSDFAEKKKLMIISPDKNPEKEDILSIVRENFEDYRQIVIRNMPYQVYRQTITKAKFSFTFGEGLDFYFLETVFSGGIGIAVYNEEFFPKNWFALPGIFNSFEDLKQNVSIFLQRAKESEANYKHIHEQQYRACSLLYSYSEYQENIRKFYLKEYKFV